MAHQPTHTAEELEEKKYLHYLLNEQTTRRKVSDKMAANLAPLCDRHWQAPPDPAPILKTTALLPACDECLKKHIAENGFDASKTFDTCVCWTDVEKAECWACKFEEMEAKRSQAIAARTDIISGQGQVIRCGCGKDVGAELLVKTGGEMEETRRCACCGGMAHMFFTNTYGEYITFEMLRENVVSYLPPVVRPATEGIYGPIDGSASVASQFPLPAASTAPVAGPSAGPGAAQEGTGTVQTAVPQHLELPSRANNDTAPTTEEVEHQKQAASDERRKQTHHFATIAMNPALDAVVNDPTNALTMQFHQHAGQAVEIKKRKRYLKYHCQRHLENVNYSDFGAGRMVKNVVHVQGMHKTRNENATLTTEACVEKVCLWNDVVDPDVPKKLRRFVGRVWGGEVQEQEKADVLRLALDYHRLFAEKGDVVDAEYV